MVGVVGVVVVVVARERARQRAREDSTQMGDGSMVVLCRVVFTVGIIALSGSVVWVEAGPRAV
jgi:heme/copper-type cytochrome/quinol oxidase subunit 2